jgi:hypothetical protein
LPVENGTGAVQRRFASPPRPIWRSFPRMFADTHLALTVLAAELRAP